MVQTEKKMKRLPGVLFALVQLICSAAFLIVTYQSGFVPKKYLLAAAAIAVILVFLVLSIHLIRRKTSIAACIFSVLISAVFCVGAYLLHDVTAAIYTIGGAEYKTDNMVVAVRKEDPAEDILDAKDYIFGVQKMADQENTEKMMKKLSTILGEGITVREYDTPLNLAEALLEEEIDAAVYNVAFSGLITDQYTDFEDQTRVLYQYGIDTKLEEVDQEITKPFNVYISGIDVYGPISTNSRSDVNIIATVNPDTRQVLLTTTPRDYYVTFPGVTGEQRDKLTHAGIYGVDVSMKTLEQLYDTEINYYVRINFTSLIQLIDMIGGVDVYSEYAFEAGGYSFQEGVNHMDGEQALAFARERHSFEEGDNQRGKNQEEVIRGIIQKMLNPSMLTKALDILKELDDSIQTNIPDQQISDLVQMQLSGGGSWEIMTTQAIGNGDSQICYSSGEQKLYVMWPDETSVKSISDKIRKILEGETLTQMK